MQQQEEITSEKNEQLVDDFSTVLTHSKVPPVLPHTKSVIGIESMHNNEVKSKAPLRDTIPILQISVLVKTQFPKY